MNRSDFRQHGKEMIDYIADYMETLKSKCVTPNVEPGFLKELLPSEPPQEAEDFKDIMKDVDSKFMPGVTHWQHRNFHAFFPTANSYPSILGDLLSSGTGCAAFSWAASPAGTELEALMLDWVGTLFGAFRPLHPNSAEISGRVLVQNARGKMVKLPKCFLHESGPGGGVMQNSASDCILVSFLTARRSAFMKLRETRESEESEEVDDGLLVSKLVAYTSELAHSSVIKCAAIGLVKIRKLVVDKHFSLRGNTLQEAIKEDREQGLVPFFVCATVGTTSCCSFDNVEEIAEICTKEDIWLHVDAAYAGNALICPEFQYLINGIQGVDSININAHKGMMVNFECSLMWVRDTEKLISEFTMNPLYLQHNHTSDAINFMNWGIPLTRRIRALKLWFVIRNYGVEGLQKNQRERVRLAKLFEECVLGDSRFEVVGKVTLGLVCFRLKGPNTVTRKLLLMINECGKLYMVPAVMGEIYVIRFTIITENAIADDVEYAWRVISRMADKLSSDLYLTHNVQMNGHRLESIEETKFFSYSNLLKNRRLSIPVGAVDSEDETDDERFRLAARKYTRGRRLSTPQIYVPCSNTHEFSN